MNAVLQDVLARIPDYDTFFTADELDQRSRELAARYPDTVSIFEIGKTAGGKPLLCLKIGAFERNALMFGCPHPNEPIGTMMLEYLSEELAVNATLRETLGVTWYIVKAWDRDGLVLNEGWLKGPYTVHNYSRHFFRPAGHKQMDWTFPIDYKDLHFHDPMPETKAMMGLIDEIKPRFIYSLHNAGFGGTYWYLSHPLPQEAYDALHQASKKVDIPLHLGEPEMPYIVPFDNAIFPMVGIAAQYDFMEENGIENIAEKINCGTCSDEYARERYGSYTLVTELPYFYDKRIMDMSPTERTRRDAVEESLDENDRSDVYIRDILARTKDVVAAENPFRLALEAFSKGDNSESTRNMIKKNPDYQRKATVAEVFDNVVLAKFYKCLSYGMAIRLAETSLVDWPQDSPEHKLLSDVFEEAVTAHREMTDSLEAALDYEVVPIKKLVSIQLESGFIVCQALKQLDNTKEG